MNCPRCQHENLPAMKFCGECGARLAAVCPACGASNAATQKFCGECGGPLAGTASAGKVASPESYTPKHLAEKILTSKAALEGERKQVTVLFADLKGSMELLADRDPEEARKLLDPVLEHMMEAVHRFEGTVNQVMGDGIMALFGAPLAHEDHAVRACYAALRMQESVTRYAEGVRREQGVTIRIRVGLNSGEVVVRAIGSDLHMDYTAIGQTTHLAARMEQLADPGATLLTPETLALAEGFVRVTSLGPMAVKGLAASVEVYELVGVSAARSRLQAAATRGLSHFVGRDAEIEQLHRAVEHARQGHGQVAAVVGAPGVGKSRLTFELTHSPQFEGWLMLQAGAVSYGKGTSYLPVIDLLKTYFRIGDRESPHEIREKVTGRLLILDRALEATLPAILALLDLSGDDAQWQALDPPQRRQRMLDAVKRLLLREAQVQPLLVVFEDLHWIDSETQALLDSLVESLPPARLLLFVNYRPEYEHHWGSKTSYSQLRLDALPPESAGELLSVLLGNDPGLEPLKRLLVRRGNPFFIEESIRTLVEAGALIRERGAYRLTRPIQAIEVPATVQVILSARIDRLPAEDKQLLQTAAVIGKDVPFVLLHAVAGAAEDAVHRGLAYLQAAEFLYETRRFPDPEYTFKHALTHEVAYGTLLQDRRKVLHARIVGAFERLYPDRLIEHVERLAHHALRGERWEQAVSYLRQAGTKAAERAALPEAVAWFEQALSALDRLPESRTTLEQAFDIRLDLRPVVNQLGNIRRTLERLREAESLAEQLNDDRRRGRVYAFMTNIHTLLGEMDESVASGARALTIAGAHGDLPLRLLTTTYLEQQYFFRGEFDRVIELASANLAALPPEAIHERFGNVAPVSVYDRGWLALSLAEVGKFPEATEASETAIQIVGASRHPFTVGWANWVAGHLHLVKGNWEQARAFLERGIAVLRAANVMLIRLTMTPASALVLAHLGETEAAISRLHEGEQFLALQPPRAGNSAPYRGSVMGHWLGQASLHLGQIEEAQRFGQYAFETAPPSSAALAYALHLLGDIAAHPDQFDAESSKAHYRQALALAERLGMRPLVAHCHLGLGKLSWHTGQREPAQEHLTTAMTMYREMDMRFYLEQAEQELRELA